MKKSLLTSNVYASIYGLKYVLFYWFSLVCSKGVIYDCMKTKEYTNSSYTPCRDTAISNPGVGFLYPPPPPPIALALMSPPPLRLR